MSHHPLLTSIVTLLRLDLDMKKLEELKKLGDLHLDFKGLEDFKKLGGLKGLDAKTLDDLKKQGIRIELNRAKEMKQAAEAAGKAKARRSEDIDARLDRLMKEIEVLRKEIRQTKEKPAK